MRMRIRVTGIVQGVGFRPFIYRIAVAGTTGERDSLPPGLRGDVAVLRRISELPVCVGFGVGQAEQISEICSFADGAIVGSAIARCISDGLERGTSRAGLIDSVARCLSELMSGLSG